MKKILAPLFILIPLFGWGQKVTLNADGPGSTYELINNTLANGNTVVEVPDCAHSTFGRHIDEIWDDTLQSYVFRFHMHVTPDNDRCQTFDRQRNEIKTYDKSPAHLKAVEGETVEYKWKFKLDAAFQPSSGFTHIHQLKAVGGSEESMPLITLTPRKSSTNKMQLRYAKNTSQTTIKEVLLADFLGEWVEVTEVVKFGESGTYNINILRLSDRKNIMQYSNNNIRMWKTGASFLRPKWGIYRSLNNPEDLRDETVLFNAFSIEELTGTSTQNLIAHARLIYPNPCRESLYIHPEMHEQIAEVHIYSTDGKLQSTICHGFDAPIDVRGFKNGMYLANIRFKNTSEINLRFIKQK